MDLIKVEILHMLRDCGFPQSKVATGQIWYDTLAGRYGVVMDGTLNYFKGGSTAITVTDKQSGRYLLNPTVGDLLFFTRKSSIRHSGTLFLVKIKDEKNPLRFTSANPAEACALAYVAVVSNS